MSSRWIEGAMLPPPRRVFYGEDLRTELVTSEEVERRCATTRAWLASWEEGPPILREVQRVLPLQVSIKASVFRVTSRDGSTVVKVHATEEAYDREILGYALLADEHPCPTPTLLGRNDEERLLVLEDVVDRAEVASGPAFAEAAACIGRVHAALQDREMMRDVFGSLTLGVHRDDVDGAAFADAAAAKRAVDLMIADRGVDHIPAIVGDLKLGHYRRRADGTPVLLDLETFTVGISETSDLLALLNLAEEEYAPSRDDWTIALGAYLLARGDAHDVERRVSDYFEAVQLTAKSLGLGATLS